MSSHVTFKKLKTVKICKIVIQKVGVVSCEIWLFKGRSNHKTDREI